MPYANVPAHMTDRMDRCVERVMRQGKSKKSAIAICHASIVGKESPMSSKEKQSRARRLRQKADLERKRSEADEALAALADAEPDVPEPEPDADEPEAVEKDYGGEMAMPMYGGGATDFDALDAYRAQQQMAEEVHDLAYDFQMLMRNVVDSPMVSDKKAALSSLAAQFSQRVNAAPSEKALPDPEPEPEGEPITQDDIDALTEDAPGMLDKFRAWWTAKVKRSDTPQALPASFHITKDTSGAWRWFGIVSNKYRDRDTRAHPNGEIITEAAHKEYTAWLDAHPDQAPELWSWHTPGTARKARADWWDFTDEGFLCMSGPLTEAEAKAFDPDEELAMSHGCLVLAKDAGAGLINQYRTFEVTELPREWPANPWTDFGVIRKEAEMAFTTEKRAHLVKRFGEDKVRELEARPAELGKALEALGVEYKAQPEQKPAPAVDEHILKAVLEALGADELRQGIAGLVEKAAKVDELETRIAEQAKTIAALQRSDDEKIAAEFEPRVKPLTWGFRATKDSQTELKPDDETHKELAQAAEHGFLAALGPIQ